MSFIFIVLICIWASRTPNLIISFIYQCILLFDLYYIMLNRGDRCCAIYFFILFSSDDSKFDIFIGKYEEKRHISDIQYFIFLICLHCSPHAAVRTYHSLSQVNLQLKVKQQIFNLSFHFIWFLQKFFTGQFGTYALYIDHNIHSFVSLFFLSLFEIRIQKQKNKIPKRCYLLILGN